ncbi:MAG TPA: biotin--[acetyl-CoA-carboxylase] ligase [Candidatus Binataceae bacterium]|nr:biotin--[acetyl-CoA-carboxylase] ligase [Candidatus Binataceae bacterium]
MPANPYQQIENGEPGRIGWRIHYFDEVASTQRVAGELADEGAAQGTVVIAERQNAGRGRMGRSWHSPASVNLYMTIIVRPSIPLGHVPRLSLVAGVAAAEALESVAPGIVALKWPNDVWLRGRKTCGIIAEAVTDAAQGLRCVLIGIGVNVNLAAEDVPPELRDKATSVRIATGRACDRIELAAALFNRLNSRYMETEAGGFAAVRPAWERYSALTGRPVVVVDGEVRTAGVVRGIDDDGALLLDTEAGQTRILTGDVSLEGAYD